MLTGVPQSWKHLRISVSSVVVAGQEMLDALLSVTRVLHRAAGEEAAQLTAEPLRPLQKLCKQQGRAAHVFCSLPGTD